MRRRVWAGLGVLLLGGGLGFALWPRPQTAPLPQVLTAPVTGGEFVREARATGRVEARVFNLAFPRSGTVSEVNVREGSVVGAGAVLARLDTAEDEDKLAAVRKALLALTTRERGAGLEASVGRERLARQLAEARQALALSRDLLSVGAAAASEVRERERAVTDARGALDLADVQARAGRDDLAGQRAGREAEIAGIEQTLRDAVLRAPRAGTVLRVEYEVGVDAGDAAGRSGDQPPGITLLEANSTRVRLRLPEAESGRVRPGQDARVTLDAFPDRTFAARVETVGAQAEPNAQGGGVTVPAVLTLQDTAALRVARPGLTVSATVTTDRIGNAVMVPLEALVEEGGSSAVWTVTPAPRRTVRRVPVEVQSRNLNMAAVSGVTANTEVILLPPPELQDGARVQVGGGP